VFDSAVTKIDFVKLVLVKNELNEKWFMSEYTCVKVSKKINLSIKITYEVKSCKSLLELRINSRAKINYNGKTSKHVDINFTKHTSVLTNSTTPKQTKNIYL
jgi:hypothetical protein